MNGNLVLPLLAERRSRVQEIRGRARRLFDGGAPGIQIATALSESTDAFLIELFEATLASARDADRRQMTGNCALVAVGGSGRGELAPYSDTDLLFLFRGSAREPFEAATAQMVRDCWDAGLKLGHSLRTVGDSIAMAKQEPQVATALIEARYLAGDAALCEQLKRQVERKVVRGRLRAFVNDCVKSRSEEQQQFGASVGQLEPDVKRAPGGLRDLHLIRWLGYAFYGTSDIDSLRLRGALDKDDARVLLAAFEFITRIRIDLHFAAGKPQDKLTKDDQLRIASERGIEPSIGQRPVERLMQQYFRHAAALSEISRRFASMHEARSASERLVRALVTHRADGIFRVGPDTIDVVSRHRAEVCGDLEQILRLYWTALLYGVLPSASLSDEVRRAQARLPADVSPEAARRFLQILGRAGHLGPVLRSMYDTGVLAVLVPNMEHARGLLQFNQYHSYTVDEHTLRAVEAACAFEQDPGTVGVACRAIHQKHILHLALLLHDLGKGFVDDHSDVGKVIAGAVAERLHLDEGERSTLEFLVHKHLIMAHLAFRRDVSDPEVLLSFSREVGSPDTLRMLYVLTASDLTAVGPDVWNDWKSELLHELYTRTLNILTGEGDGERPAESHAIRARFQDMRGPAARDDETWLDEQLVGLPSHYVGATPAERIADDLRVIRGLAPGQLEIETAYDPVTRTSDFRVIAHADLADGCFHKMTGVLTAKRLAILSAQICTTRDGMVIDAFRVLDDAFMESATQQARLDDVSAALRAALTGATAIEPLFQRYMRFEDSRNEPLSDLPTRVTIDNQTSERCTIVDVFAHDRTGLLYTLTRTLADLGVSVQIAKIATHLDQVVDVFYVTDRENRKIFDENWLKAIQKTLIERIDEFQQHGYLAFRS